MSARQRARGRRHIAGLALVELAVALLLLTLGAVWAATRLVNTLDDAAATATARHLLAVRGQVQALLVRYYDALSGWPDDPSDPRPAVLAGAGPWDLPVSELLGEAWAVAPPLGGGVRIQLARVGACPGADCTLQALAYTREPLRARGATEPQPALIGQFLLASDGYGGHAPPNAPGRLRGAWFDVPNPLGEQVGVVGVSAALDTTPFHQFVRHRDTRPVVLQNSLTVAGTLTTQQGLQLATAVVPGSLCAEARLYAATANGALAQCLDGTWFTLDDHLVLGQVSDLADGDAVPTPACPASSQPFVWVALQAVARTLRGDEIDVQADLSGVVQGQGQVSASGAVQVSGTFQGAARSRPESWVRLAQAVSVQQGRVQVQPADSAARVQAIYGCRRA